MTLVTRIPHQGCYGPQSVTPQCLWHPYHPPTKWLMRSNDELHSQFNPGAWDFIHRTDCRGDVCPNPGHLWSHCFLHGWSYGQWKTWRGNLKTKDLLKSAKKSAPSYNYAPYYITGAEICRPGVAIQQTFRFIDSAAAPLGLRLIAGWIKPQWLTDELQHWGDMREMNVEE